MILSQLVDAEELEGLSPEELRDMILELDEQVNYGSNEVLHLRPASAEAPTQTSD